MSAQLCPGLTCFCAHLIRQPCAGSDTLDADTTAALLDWLVVLVDLLPSGAGGTAVAATLVPLLLQTPDGLTSSQW